MIIHTFIRGNPWSQLYVTPDGPDRSGGGSSRHPPDRKNDAAAIFLCRNL